MRRRWRVRILRTRAHIRLILGVVDGWLGYVGISIDWRALRWPKWSDLLGNHVRIHPSHVVAGARSRAHLWLWCVDSLDALEDDPIRYRRGCRGGMMPDLRERRLALEVLRHHVVCIGRSAVLVIVVIVIATAIEVRGSFVLVWSTMLLLIWIISLYSLVDARLRFCGFGGDLRMCIW